MKINLPITTSSLVKSGALALALSTYAFSAGAAPTPYADTGTENSIQYSFVAQTTGDIIAYFVDKGGAIYTNTLSITVNGVASAVSGLSNQSSSYGDSLNFGSVNAGDSIVFTLNVTDTGANWYSDKSLNSDGVNRIYSSAFSGDEFLPAGTYVAFEDLTDFNYLDEQFVVTNVTAPAVPVPATVWLFGSGLLGLAGVTRRRSKTA